MECDQTCFIALFNLLIYPLGAIVWTGQLCASIIKVVLPLTLNDHRVWVSPSETAVVKHCCQGDETALIADSMVSVGVRIDSHTDTDTIALSLYRLSLPSSVPPATNASGGKVQWDKVGAKTPER